MIWVILQIPHHFSASPWHRGIALCLEVLVKLILEARQLSALDALGLGNFMGSYRGLSSPNVTPLPPRNKPLIRPLVKVNQRPLIRAYIFLWGGEGIGRFPWMFFLVLGLFNENHIPGLVTDWYVG